MRDIHRRHPLVTAVAALVIAALAFPVVAYAVATPADPPSPYAAYTKKRRQVVYRGGGKRFVWVSVQNAAAPAPAPAPVPVTEQALAENVLAGLKTTYPRYLGGVTVSIGATPNGYQAVCYYREGSIVVSPTHTASLQEILSHEIWHVIDWRDNGCIDWRESIPPANAADYRG